MSVIICAGIHEATLTQKFVEGLGLSGNILIFPTQDFSALSAFHIVQFLCDRGSPQHTSPLIFIGFSAGNVGAISAANWWQLWGGKVKAFIAIDGWGVPLLGNFPLHRLSHDYFTDWSSAILGSGEDRFYADPPVAHLEMWRSPQTVTGWWIPSNPRQNQARTYTSASKFLTMLLTRYQTEA